jgi:hypothetical protein
MASEYQFRRVIDKSLSYRFLTVAARKRCRSDAVGSDERSFSGEVLSPRFPIIGFPAFADSFVVLFGHVEMDQIDAAVLAFRNKAED